MANSIGSGAISMGLNSVASGTSSVTIGAGNIASGHNAIAIGSGGIVRKFSTAMGETTITRRNAHYHRKVYKSIRTTSTAMGENSISSGRLSASMGLNSFHGKFQIRFLSSEMEILTPVEAMP
ncbi:MAG: hypothetical protein IPK25_00130 [Saprospiraceae bacterium]|nr:hypothetical protein [Saprospiraceae bacterium]